MSAARAARRRALPAFRGAAARFTRRTGLPVHPAFLNSHVMIGWDDIGDVLAQVAVYPAYYELFAEFAAIQRQHGLT